MNCIYSVSLNNTKDIEEASLRDSLGRQPSSRENRDSSECFCLHRSVGLAVCTVHVIVHAPTAKACSASPPGWSLEIQSCSHLVVIRLPASATLSAFLTLSTQCDFLLSHTTKQARSETEIL